MRIIDKYIKRKVYNELLEWKQKSNGTKALLIEGARRIGKSTIAEEFGKNEYKSYILIDFNNVSKGIIEAFDHLNNLDLFFQIINLETGIRLYKRNTLIILMKFKNFQKQEKP